MVRRRQEDEAGSGRAVLEGEENHYCQLRLGVVIIIVVHDCIASGLNNCLGDVCGALEVPEQPLWGREGTP